MWVPNPNKLVVRRPSPFREGRDLDHHVSACSEGARACWGGVPGLLSGRPPLLLGGGRGSKRSAPMFQQVVFLPQTNEHHEPLNGQVDPSTTLNPRPHD